MPVPAPRLLDRERHRIGGQLVEPHADSERVLVVDRHAAVVV
jgi:hypothetical protein